MSPRERRLRERIDTLIDQRDWYKARAKPRRAKATPARCVYCSEPTKSYGHPATCPCHRDLVALDPSYNGAQVA